MKQNYQKQENRPARSAAQCIRFFMATHPMERACIERGIVNYSALARELRKIFSGISIQAFVIALRRYRARQTSTTSQDPIVQKLVTKSRLSLETKISVAVLEGVRDFGPLYTLQGEIRKERGVCNIIEGRSAATIIHSARYSQKIEHLTKRRLLRMIDNLCQIVIEFDLAFETTPGVVAHIYSLLAFHGINVREEMSCGTELLLVLNNVDGSRAIRILQGE